jgi:hypothetical protein
MRQTGRTTRIVQHVVEQLFNTGKCISTDHIVYEYSNIGKNSLLEFVDKVRRQVETYSHGSKTIDSEFIKVKDYNMVYFTMKDNKQ